MRTLEIRLEIEIKHTVGEPRPHTLISNKANMGTNEGWPEAFGFSISGGDPVVISEVEDGGSAQQAGLQPGDAIIELDGVCVEQWSRLEVHS